MNWLENLPAAVRDFLYLLFVAVIAGSAAGARILYGVKNNEPIPWRVLTGGILMGGFTAFMVAGFLADHTNLSVNFGAATGTCVGLFTNEFLKFSQRWITKKLNLEEPKQQPNLEEPKQ